MRTDCQKLARRRYEKLPHPPVRSIEICLAFERTLLVACSRGALHIVPPSTDGDCTRAFVPRERTSRRKRFVKFAGGGQRQISCTQRYCGRTPGRAPDRRRWGEGPSCKCVGARALRIHGSARRRRGPSPSRGRLACCILRSVVIRG